MKSVLKDNENNYLVFQRNTSPYKTTDIRKATIFDSEENAKIRLFSSASKNDRNKFSPVPYEVSEQNQYYKKVDILSLKKKVNTELEPIKDIFNNKELLYDRLSELDQILVDIQHLIEFNKFNLVDGYMVYKLQYIALNKRREIKNQIEHIDFFKRATVADVICGKMDEHFERMDNKQYKVRTSVIEPLFNAKHIASVFVKDFKEKVESFI